MCITSSAEAVPRAPPPEPRRDGSFRRVRVAHVNKENTRSCSGHDRDQLDLLAGELLQGLGVDRLERQPIAPPRRADEVVDLGNDGLVVYGRQVNRCGERRLFGGDEQRARRRTEVLPDDEHGVAGLVSYVEKDGPLECLAHERDIVTGVRLENLIEARDKPPVLQDAQNVERSRAHVQVFVAEILERQFPRVGVRVCRQALPRAHAAVQDLAGDQGIPTPIAPHIHLEADPSLPLDSFAIHQGAPSSGTGETKAITLPLKPSGDIDNQPEFYIIYEENRLFPLLEPAINIGRGPHNNLVIDDPRVSRLHAQIRFVDGVYNIFDLNSRGGTFVNGQQVEQTALKSGDIISLAGCSLRYLDSPPQISAHPSQTIPNPNP